MLKSLLLYKRKIIPPTISQACLVRFATDFGFDGTDGLLNFPVFETWGNHDGPPEGREKFGFSFQAQLKERNQRRQHKGWLTNLSTNGLHYSWDWDDVHCVMLGLYPADVQNPLLKKRVREEKLPDGKRRVIWNGTWEWRHILKKELPNDLAYCETCAAIANVLWQHRLFLRSGNAAYIDVLERSLYNNVLAGIALEGNRFFYGNPLAVHAQRKFNRFGWTGCPCCPVNLVRFIPRVGDYLYAVRGDDVYVNLFAASQTRIRLPHGGLALRQETRYPWEGRVLLEITAAPPIPILLHIRLPGWANGRPVPSDRYRYVNPEAEPVSLRLNDQPVNFTEENGYVVLHRAWQPGDQVELILPMPIRRVQAHPQVTADAGLVAIERGPLIYCVEGVDHEGEALNLVLPDDARLTTTEQPGLLGGITVIETTGRRIIGGRSGQIEPERLRLIPYYAWNHRGSGSMAVWLPREARFAQLPYDTSKWVGANYTPAYAANRVQMWHEFKPDIIERELAAAQKQLGVTSLRVYLHNIVFDAERELFLSRNRLLGRSSVHGYCQRAQRRGRFRWTLEPASRAESAQGHCLYRSRGALVWQEAAEQRITD